MFMKTELEFAVLTLFEVAETKVEAVHGLAKQYEYPLQATMEEN